MQQIQILSVGSGGCGLLLQLNLQDLNIPQPLTAIDVKENLKINFNGLIGLFKSKTALYIYGQLNTLITIPRLLELQKVTRFSCGWQHALIQCDSLIYGIGSNKFYELGCPKREIYQDPQLIIDCQAIDIACGFRQSFIIRKDDILVSGQNKNNELCSSDFQVAEQFTVVKVGNLKKIKCGQKFTLALTNENQLYGWGSNTFGQLAQPAEKIVQKKLLMENVVHFDCGWSHQIVQTSTGVYVCGRGDLGQQGDNQKQHNEEYKKVNIVGINVKCGSESTIIISVLSEIYVTGWNEHGNLGLGHNENVYQFERLNGFHKVKCKGASMFLYK